MAGMQARLGRPAVDYAAAGYAAMWWAARAHFPSGHSRDSAELKRALEAILMTETGLRVVFVTGDSLFNAAGDETRGRYVFYRVVEENGSLRREEHAAFEYR